MTKYNPNIHHRQSIRLKGYDYSQAGLYFITICCWNRNSLFGKIERAKNMSTDNKITKMILNDAGKIANDCWLNIPNHFPNVILHEYIIMPNHIHGIIELVGSQHAPGNGANQHAPKNEMVRANQHAPENEMVRANQYSPKNEMVRANQYSPKNDVNQSSPKNGVNQHLPDNEINNHGGFGDDGVFGDDGSFCDNMAFGDNRAKNISPLRSPSKTIGSVVRGFKIGVTKWMRKNTDVHDVWQRNYYEKIIRNEKSYKNISQYIINNPAKWADDKFYK